jgi:hypothetical protein
MLQYVKHAPANASPVARPRRLDERAARFLLPRGRWSGIRVWLGLFALVATSAAAWTPASAQVEITPQIGYFIFNGDADRDIEVNDDAPIYALRIGVVFPGGRWGLEGSTGVVRSAAPPPDERDTAHSFYVGGAGLVHFTNASRATPFLAAGAEILDFDHSAAAIGDESRFNLVWGGGLKVDLSPHFAVRLDGRHHTGTTTDDRDAERREFRLNHFEIAAGLTWRPAVFGASNRMAAGGKS